MSRIQLLAGASAALNLGTALTVLIAVFTRFPTVEGDGNRFHSGAKTFRYFTTDSNLFAALACLILTPFSLRIAITGAGTLPAWAQALKYTAVCAVTLTLLTVLFFLAPTQGFDKMFGGANLWLHLICPLVCILSFLFFESRERLDLWVTFPALVPILLYSAVYLVMVVVVGEDRGGWKDFYGFNRGGKWYLALPLMLGTAYLIALGQWTLSNLAWRWFA